MRFKHILILILNLFIILSLSSCVEDPIDDGMDIEENSECTSTILYNVVGSSPDNANFAIAIKQGAEETILVSDPDFDFWWARLSPDKTSFICYKSPIGDNRPDNDYSRAELWKFDIDGSNGELLISLDTYDWMEQGVADWSPDGKYLVMAAVIVEDPAKPEDFFWQLFRTDSDGSNLKQLTSGPGLRGDPSWSPTGDKIVYVSFPQDYDSGNLIQLLADVLTQNPLEIHIADISEAGILSNIEQLTDDNTRDNDPYYSHDGKFIAWESFDDQAGVIRQYDFDKNGVSTILDIDEFVCCPSWIEDSNIFLIHSLKFGRPFYIGEYDILTEQFEPVLKNNQIGYINPQWVCWPN